MAVSIVGRRLDYCNSVLYGMSQANILTSYSVCKISYAKYAKKLNSKSRIECFYSGITEIGFVYRLTIIQTFS